MAYRDTILADTPLAYWRMEEASGALIDETANGFDLAVGHAPTYQQAGAGSFTGFGIYYDRAIPQDYHYRDESGFSSGASSGSIEFYFKSLAAGTGYYYIFSNRGAAGTSDDWLHIYMYLGHIYITTKANGGLPNTVYWGSGLNDGQWHHIVITSNGSTWSGYVDGQSASPNIQFGSNTGDWFGDLVSTEYMSVGAHYRDGADLANTGFTGTLDEIAIYDYQLSAGQVSSHYSASGIVPTEITISAIEEGDNFSASVSVADPFSATMAIAEGDDAGSFSITHAWWAAAAPIERIFYRLFIEAAGFADYELPLKSWQATVQTDRQSYAQAVIPAVPGYAEEIAQRQAGEFVIFRCALIGGAEFQKEIARAPIDQFRIDRGSMSASITLSGYWSQSATGSGTLELENVRLVSIDSGYRARSAIDFAILPGVTVQADEYTFVADYINFYVSGGDEYMDVGERGAG